MQEQPYISLKQLLTSIQNQMRAAFPSSYWIKAEVAGVRKIGSHIYFDLIELEHGAKVAQIRACAFLGEGTMAIEGFEKVTGQKFTEGIKIGVRVTVNYHPVYGLSLVLCEIDTALTLGGIELQRKQTLQKLLQLHPKSIRMINGQYVTPNKLLPLPKAIQRIALITSLNSDAYSDFMHSLEINEYNYKFKVDTYNVLVQGYGAQPSLYDAFSKVIVSGKRYDAVVLTRGGGAPADFLPFDDFHLALRVAEFSIPVITGIGHHTNQGISDFFARVHTKTPSMAAQFILDHNHNFEKRIQQYSAAIVNIASDLLSRNAQNFQDLKRNVSAAVNSIVQNSHLNLNSLEAGIFAKTNQLLVHTSNNLSNKRLLISNKAQTVLYQFKTGLAEKALSFTFTPKQIIRRENQSLIGLQHNLINRLPQVLSAEKRDLSRLSEGIENLNPEKILQRGFAILKKEGKILNDPADISLGDSLQIIHRSTLIDTEVKHKTDLNG